MKRLAIYTFWDKEGILHQYHMQYLSGLKEIAETVLLVANGELTQESRFKLEAAGIKWLVRENKGFDFSAWKAGLEHFGQSFVLSFDELILCNCSCYGPIFPFPNAFEKMASSPCDFWGIYRQPDHPDGKYTSHIQSFFYVFRHIILEAEHFWAWWKNLIPSNSYEEEIFGHETIFTAYLEKAGFRSDTLMSVKKYDNIAPIGFATLYHGDIMVMQDNCPLLKRKYIFERESNIKEIILYIINNTNFNAIDIYNDIKRNTDIRIKKMIKYYFRSIFHKTQKKKYDQIFKKMYMVWKWKRKGFTSLK